ncbi:MAG: hypothetical protein ABIL02_06935 [candidate division WOR-3 bacterium]
MKIQASEIRKYLKDYRSYRDRIHLIVAGKYSDYPNLYGITVNYIQPSYGGSGVPGYVSHHATCGNYATSDDSSSQAHLDSCGIYIFVTTIKYDIDHNQNWIWSYKEGIGTIIAHEIGHALGISSHNEAVMEDINLKTDGPAVNYNHFDTTKLNIKPPYDAVNTRDVLGIYTVDIGF